MTFQVLPKSHERKGAMRVSISRVHGTIRLTKAVTEFLKSDRVIVMFDDETKKLAIKATNADDPNGRPIYKNGMSVGLSKYITEWGMKNHLTSIVATVEGDMVVVDLSGHATFGGGE